MKGKRMAKDEVPMAQPNGMMIPNEQDKEIVRKLQGFELEYISSGPKTVIGENLGQQRTKSVDLKSMAKLGGDMLTRLHLSSKN